jgi:hypothetical protein
MHHLVLDFQNFRTGRLDPSYDAIARKAGCCRRTVADALRRLRDLGMLGWLRRCEEDRDKAGRFRLRQRTNAYGLMPPSQWRGYGDPTEPPPPPSPDTLGTPERVPDPIKPPLQSLPAASARRLWRHWRPIPATRWRGPWQRSGGR